MGLPGLQGNGYTQVWDRLGWVNVKDYGAIGDGVHDDAPAIQAAFNSLGSPSNGVLYMPPGTYRLGSTVNMTLGYPNAAADGQNSTIAVSTFPRFILQCDGQIQPDAGIGDAIYISEGYFPIIKVQFAGGGQSGDHALRLEKLFGPEFAVVGWDYGGTVLYSAMGEQQGSNRVTEVKNAIVMSVHCGQTIFLGETSAYGTFLKIWDDSSAKGSEFADTGDVIVWHYGNYTTETDGASLTLGGGTMHFGVIEIGNSSSPLLQITSAAVHIGDLFCLGEGTTQDGVIVSGGWAAIDHLYTNSCRYGLRVQGATVQVGVHTDENSIVPVSLETSSAYGAVDTCTISAFNYSDFTSQAVEIASGLTGGSLTLTNGTLGSTSGRSSTQTSYAIANSAPSAFSIKLTNVTETASTYMNAGFSTGSLAGVSMSGCNFADGVLVNGVSTPASGGIVAGGNQWNTAAPTSLAGTTAGTIQWSMPEQGTAYKKFVGVLVGYENTTTTAQTIAFPTAFANPPTITSQPSGFGATATTTTLTLPTGMSAAVNGVVVIEGI